MLGHGRSTPVARHLAPSSTSLRAAQASSCEIGLRATSTSPRNGCIQAVWLPWSLQKDLGPAVVLRRQHGLHACRRRVPPAQRRGATHGLRSKPYVVVGRTRRGHEETAWTQILKRCWRPPIRMTTMTGHLQSGTAGRHSHDHQLGLGTLQQQHRHCQHQRWHRRQAWRLRPQMHSTRFFGSALAAHRDRQ